MKISEHLHHIAQVAKQEQAYLGHDREHFVVTLSDLADRLRHISQGLTEKGAREFQTRAGWAEAYCKAICEDDEIGQMTFWAEMRAIEGLANRCLGSIKPKQKNNLIKVFASRVEEFYSGLFFMLQRDELLEKDCKPIKMRGEVKAVTRFYIDQIQGLIDELYEDQYPAILVLWKQFLQADSRDQKKLIKILEVLIKFVTEGSDDEGETEITPEQYASVKKAIVNGHLGEIQAQMLSFPMNSLADELKVALVKMAIDQPKLAILECFVECDWFNDMSMEAFIEVAEYAKEKERKAHRGIILGSSGYMIQKKFAESKVDLSA